MHYHRSDMSRKSNVNPKVRAARLGGRANTPAQNRARALNAQKAGRPKRVCKKCRQPVLGGHVDRTLDTTCGAHGWQWEQAGKRHPAPPNLEAQALDAIAAALNDPSLPNVLEFIRTAVRDSGRAVS